jgi:hypothetical protein
MGSDADTGQLERKPAHRPCEILFERMAQVGEEQGFLLKAEESLAAAASELANGRYNSCANRCYYACFVRPGTDHQQRAGGSIGREMMPMG